MFYGCKALTSLDLSSFDTNAITTMDGMFINASKLTLIEVSDKWVIGENTTVTDMFAGCGTNTVTLKQ